MTKQSNNQNKIHFVSDEQLEQIIQLVGKEIKEIKPRIHTGSVPYFIKHNSNTLVLHGLSNDNFVGIYFDGEIKIDYPPSFVGQWNEFCYYRDIPCTISVNNETFPNSFCFSFIDGILTKFDVVDKNVHFGLNPKIENGYDQGEDNKHTLGPFYYDHEKGVSFISNLKDSHLKIDEENFNPKKELIDQHKCAIVYFN